MLAMGLEAKIDKVFSNRYVLYGVVALTALNMLGYMCAQRLNALILFGLVGFLMTQFSKNMAIVLLVALVATNLLVGQTTLVREGMTDSSGAGSEDDTGEIADNDIKKNVAVLKKMPKGATKDKLKARVDEHDVIDDSSPDVTPTDTSADTTEGFDDAPAAKRKSRIDYGSTLDESYRNLSTMLDSNGIKSLTADTKNLMAQQKELFSHMESMTPLLNSAKELLSGMGGLGGVTKMLEGLNVPVAANATTATVIKAKK